MFGWYYSDWLAWIEFPTHFPEFKYDKKQLEQWREWIAIAKSTHGFLAFDGICFVSDRPTRLTVDDQGRLHNESGAALQYADSYSFYSWHGVTIDWDKAYIIEHPEQITTELIEAEANAEVRRVMIERYGQDRFIIDSKAQKIHEDDFGVLYEKELKDDPEPMVMVKVVNATAEPTGEYKDYWIRVDPKCRTAKQAVAWSFNKTEEEYCPMIQT
jgi:hypothetical protein